VFFLTHWHVSAKAASTALTCDSEDCQPASECGVTVPVRFISRLGLEYKKQAWRHVYVCIRLYHGECDISNPARGHTVTVLAANLNSSARLERAMNFSVAGVVRVYVPR
jgi:hypothetical protein